jgi:methionyl-tRNA formyltransferase
MTKLKPLVFFGSGPVGAATLAGLKEAGSEFEAVITKPRLTHHKGDMPVLDFANQHKIPIFTPKDDVELSDIFRKTSFNSNLGLVVDYGILIAKDVIDSFELGIVNSHFSLLPQWRGADPITFAILSGQDTTGVSLMLVEESLDTGTLLTQEKLPISKQETTPELTEKLINLSNELLIANLPKYMDGLIKPYPQDPSVEPTYSRRLTKEDGRIDWSKPAEILEREIRAYLGWPRSFAELFGKQVIVTKAKVLPRGPVDFAGLWMDCGDGKRLEIQELIAPSGRTMSGADFIRGYKR